ncbi:MAG: AAA family ATPase [Pseudomonadota bacterium]
MLLRKNTPEQAEAVVSFFELEAAEELSQQLDEAFGDDGWVAAPFDGAQATMRRVAAEGGLYMIVGVQAEEETQLSAARRLIADAKECGLKVILLAETLSPSSIHALMRSGADDFAPLPLPAAALSESLGRLRSGGATKMGDAGGSRNGSIYAVYGAAGGVGATTFAVNLAWETAMETLRDGAEVAILDFNFQYGSVATYLDLPRREAIYELLTDTSSLDDEGLSQTLTIYQKNLSVLTAPMDVLPLDIIGPDDVKAILDIARKRYDYVFVDMPQALTLWSDLVLTESDTYFALMETDMRSAQNMLRFLRAVKAEELPIEKVAVVLNRTPSFTDLTGKNRARKLEQSLGIEFAHRLSDGGKGVEAACDQGAPLARAAKNSPLRKEIRKAAQALIKTTAEAKAL